MKHTQLSKIIELFNDYINKRSDIMIKKIDNYFQITKKKRIKPV